MPYINLDATDLRIMKVLQEDGKLSNTDLSEKVGLSASPCLRRVRRLEQDGFIQTYRAVLDRQAIGLSLTVFLAIKQESASQDAVEQLESELRTMPEIINCHATSGDSDYLVELVVSNVNAFEKLLSKTLRKLPNIREIRSTIALKSIKSESPLPLSHLKRERGKAREILQDC